MSEPIRRNDVLDGLRFAAALSVVFYHYCFRGALSPVYLDVNFPELSFVAEYGFLGVELFFVISGYVILISLSGRSFGEFMLGRLIRIYPTFWLCAFLTVVVIALLGQPRLAVGYQDWLKNIPIAAPFLGGRYIDGVYWSLVLEIEFYLIAGGIYFLVKRRNVPFALACWVGCDFLAANFVRVAGHSLPLLGDGYAPFFGIGAAIYFMQNKRRERGVLLLLLLSLVLASVKLMSVEKIVESQYGVRLDFRLVLALTFLSVAAVYYSGSVRVRSERWAWVLGMAGGVTYPIYLLHQYIGYAILNEFFSDGRRYLGLAVVLLAVFFLSLIVYVFFDRPVRRYLMGCLQHRSRRGTVPSKLGA